MTSQPSGTKRFTIAVLSLLAFAAAARGQVLTVNTTDDVVDFPAPQQAGELPGPDGKVSFREACIAANNTPGPQTIAFAIPNEPSEEWSGGVAILFMDFNVFLLSDDDTTVDFTTQTAFTGDTNPNGNEVGIRTAPITGAPAIYVSGDRCTIKGLDRVFYCGYGVKLTGNDNRVIGCTISGPLYAGVYINGVFNGEPAMGNVVGGTEPGEGNVLSSGNSGVRIDGPAENNVVIGNTLSGSFFGVEVRSPTCCPGNDAIDNRIGGPLPGERNIIRGAGKYGEEGFPTGGQVAVQYSLGTIVEGNYVGVEADGATIPATQRGPVGVEVRSSPGTIVRNNLIGGILVVGVNHYAGQRFGNGINVMGDCTGTLIQGNRIGVSEAGDVLLNRANISVVPWSVDGSPVTPGPIAIGGVEEGLGNVIAHSETHGIRVSNPINRVHISGNSIHSNATLGIDLLSSSGGGGVTPNDPGDADTGANMLQNFPVLSAAHTDGASVTIEGELNSAANSLYQIEFFASGVCDPSGHGEGESFIGQTEVTTDASGNADFTATFFAEVPIDAAVTASATDSLGNTSEFSACVSAAAGAPLTGDLDCDGDVDLDDWALFMGCMTGSQQRVSEGCEPADMDADFDADLADAAILQTSSGP